MPIIVDETWPDGTPKRDHVENEEGKVTERREYNKEGKETNKNEYEEDGVTTKKTTETEYDGKGRKKKTTEKDYVERKRSKETETSYDDEEREITKKEKEYEKDSVTVKKEKVTETRYKKKGARSWKETVETEIEYEKGKKKLKTETHTKFCPEPNSNVVNVRQVIKYQWTGQRWVEILPRAPPEICECPSEDSSSHPSSEKTYNRAVAFLAAAIIFSVLGYTSHNHLFYVSGVGSLFIAVLTYLKRPSEED